MNISEQQIERLVVALEHLTFGDSHAPRGLEALTMALNGGNFDDNACGAVQSVGLAIAEHGEKVAGAIAEHGEVLAGAIVEHGNAVRAVAEALIDVAEAMREGQKQPGE
jgi:hypothetical protein